MSASWNQNLIKLQMYINGRARVIIETLSPAEINLVMDAGEAPAPASTRRVAESYAVSAGKQISLPRLSRKKYQRRSSQARASGT